MIPAAFDYIRAGSLADAIDLLQRDRAGRLIDDPDEVCAVLGEHRRGGQAQ